jgi:integrase
VAWIGKGRRSRSIVVGDRLRQVLTDYLARYEAALGRPLRADEPLICREQPGAGTGRLSWGNRIAQTCSVRRLVALRAAQAGIGHLSPHDLRRTAASILHRATTADGAHHFNLLDIQKVLDHQDPATTMRSYIDPMSSTVKERAAHFLD